MQPTQAHIRPLGAISVRDLVSAVCVGDINLDHDQVRLIIQIELLYVLVLEEDFIVCVQVAG